MEQTKEHKERKEMADIELPQEVTQWELNQF